MDKIEVLDHGSVRLEEANRIVAAVIREHKLHRDDFFGYAKQPYLRAARSDAINRLYDTHFTMEVIAHVVRRAVSTVRDELSMAGKRRPRRGMSPKLETPVAAKTIVDAVIAEHGISHEEFFGPRRTAELTAARKDAARRLYGRFRINVIGRAIGRDHRTVYSYIDDGLALALRYFNRSSKTFCHLNQEERLAIAKICVERKIAPMQLMCRWVSDRLKTERFR